MSSLSSSLPGATPNASSSSSSNNNNKTSKSTPQLSSTISHHSSYIINLASSHHAKTKQQRSLLSTKTKDFKKKISQLSSSFEASSSSSNGSSNNNATTVSSIQSYIAPLLKLYQEEIDRLTRLEKDVEKEYTALFKEYKELEDPINFYNRNYQRMLKLDSLEEQLKRSQKEQHQNSDAAKQNVKLEKKLAKLEEKLRSYEQEFAQLKNQEVTIASLEEEKKSLQKQIKEKETSMREENLQKRDKEKRDLVDKYEHSLKLLQDENSKLQSEVESARKLHEMSQNELYNVKRGLEDEDTGKQAHIDLLNQEIQKLNAKVLHLEQKKDATRSPTLDNADPSVQGSAHAQRELQSKQDELDAQNKRLENLNQQLEQKNQTIRTLEQSLEDLQDQTETLNTELSERPTKRAFQAVEDRLRMLEKLQFASTFEKSSSGSTEATEELLSEKSIEWILQQKVQHLEDELTQARHQLQSKEQQLENLRHSSEELQKKYRQQAQLVHQLEEDLENLQQNQEDSSTLGSLSSPLPAEQSDSSKTQTAFASQKSGKSFKSSDDMLKIVSEQRNRYKSRLTSMEEENQSHKNRIKELSSQVDKLTEENVNLYGRIRYLKSYKSDSQHGGGSFSRVNASMEDPAYAEDPVQSKYKSLYEKNIHHSLNPMSRFEKRERDEHFDRMTWIERVAIKITGIIFRSKVGRVFSFFWIILLHLFIFFLLFRMSRFRCNPSLQSLNGLHPETLHEMR